MRIQLQDDAAPLPNEKGLLEQLQRIATADHGPARGIIAVAGKGAQVRVLITCHTEDEDFDTCMRLEELGYTDLLSEDEEVEQAIGKATVAAIRHAVGLSLDALYVIVPRH